MTEGGEGIAKRTATEDLRLRWRRGLRRARLAVRKSAVDYFRGDASDWAGLAVLLLTVPVLAATTVNAPVWCPPSAVVLPILAGGLLLRPSSLLLLYAASAVALVAESAVLGPYREGPARVTPGTVLVVTAVALSGLIIAQFRARVGVPWRRGHTMLFDLREDRKST